MPNQSHSRLRFGAIASSLLLVSGFIAYRTGIIVPQNLMGLDRPRAPLDHKAAKSDITQVVYQSSANASQSDASLAEMQLKVLEEQYERDQKSQQSQVPSKSHSAQSKPLTVMAGSKSIVLLDAKVAKQKAKAAWSFAECDRNRDGKLTRDELDDETWKKCLEQHVIEDQAVNSAGFQKVFLAESDQKSVHVDQK